jgi:predicted ATPase
MLTSIKIENFKAFADSGEIPLKPLTFLMGPNSSGKSSLIQALLVIKQTLDTRDRSRQLVSEGELTSVGSYQDFVFRHESDRRVRFGASFKVAPDAMAERMGRTAPALARYIGTDGMAISNIRFDVEFQRQARTHRVFPTTTTITTSPDVINLQRTLSSRGVYRTQLEIPQFSVSYDAETEGPSRFHEAFPASEPRSIGSWPHEQMELWDERPRASRVAQLQHSMFSWTRSLTHRMALAIQRQFGELAYLGPMRVIPDRLYLATGEAPEDVGLMGEMTFEALWSTQSGHRRPTELLRWVNKWMANLDIAARVRLVRLAGSNYYSLVITDSKTNTEINLVDTGFGASQVLPIIVQGLYGPKDRTLLLEQPEIHLHPRGQSVLADCLLDMVKSGLSLIVETHSEHIINRVQRRIAEGEFKCGNVAIHYFQRTKEGSQIVPLELNEYGQFEDHGIPAGFFDEQYLETVELFKAISARKRGEL